MEKIVFLNKLFSNKREELINMCVELQRKGKNFIYLLPSSEALSDVRIKFAEKNKGFLSSKVIVFDDLEMEITKNHIPKGNIVHNPLDKLIISKICSRLNDEGKLEYYGKIYDKKGFHEEIISFIRTLKRSYKNEEINSLLKDKLNDELTTKKLQDLNLICKLYSENLREHKLYDRNDIALKAVELVNKYEGFNNIDSIIIDGFTDMDKVDMEIIKEISKLDLVNIYVSCPYRNKFMEGFLEKEICEPFKAMGFNIVYEDSNIINVDDNLKELCEKFYSGDKLKTVTKSLKLYKYPCIESEVRETARSIKEKLMAGEEPGKTAVYINNKDDYNDHLINIFNEFNIPISLKYEVPIYSSEIIRKIVNDFNDNKNVMPEQYISSLLEKIELKKDYVSKLLEKAIDSELDFEDLIEIKAIDTFKNFIGEIKENVKELKLMDGQADIEYFIRILNQSLKDIKVNITKGNNSGVKILSNSLAKAVYFDHVYILGLNEGEVPRNINSNGLFDRAEAKILAENGIRYKDYLWELNREKIRFNLTLASAKKSITLSYRGSGEDGNFAIASSFIDEVKFMTELKEEKEFSMRSRFQLDCNDAMSKSELEGAFIKEYFENRYLGNETSTLDKKLEVVKEYNNDIKSIIDNGLIEYHREMGKDFNEYEGILGDDFAEIVDKLCKFSASKLNDYASCPFKFMMSTLLELGEEEKDDSNFSALEISSLYRDVLAEYYNEVKDDTNFDIYNEDLCEKIFADKIEQFKNKKIPDVEYDVKISEVKENIKRFISLDLDRLNQYEKETKNIIKPYIINKYLEDEEAFGDKITCYIDRVDIEYECNEGKFEPTGRYVILNYKKNSLNKSDESVLGKFLKNEEYKLPIQYYLIEKELKKSLQIDNVECMGILYLSVEKKSSGNIEEVYKDGIYKTKYKSELGLGKKRSDINESNFEYVMNYVKISIKDSIDLIKLGKFNYKLSCDFFENDFNKYPCGFEKTCRYNKNKIRVMAGE